MEASVIAILHALPPFIVAIISKNIRWTLLAGAVSGFIAIGFGSTAFVLVDLAAVALGLLAGLSHVARNDHVADQNSGACDVAAEVVPAAAVEPSDSEKKSSIRKHKEQNPHSPPSLPNSFSTTEARGVSPDMSQRGQRVGLGDEVAARAAAARVETGMQTRWKPDHLHKPDGTPISSSPPPFGISSSSDDLRNLDYALGYSLGRESDWCSVINRICEDPSHRDWRWAEAPPSAVASYRKWFPGFSESLRATEDFGHAWDLCVDEMRRIIFANDELRELSSISYLQEMTVSSRIKSTLRGERLGHRAIEGRRSFVALQRRAVNKIADRLDGYAHAVND